MTKNEERMKKREALPKKKEREREREKDGKIEGIFILYEKRSRRIQFNGGNNSDAATTVTE